ncbi:hypothetical protein DL96DRAFT_1611043 [Flagelloscypha sp. PMI_526]|nr:hypothetical protein DL96DRAFT_1611043 [Flagelloscypha sp. PMI_526]
MASIDLAPELWAEVFTHCTKLDMAHMMLVNSRFVEVSQNALYRKLTIRGTSAPTTIALLNRPHCAKRLRHLVMDMHCVANIFEDWPDGSSTITTLLDVLKSSGLLRLDMVEVRYPRSPDFDPTLLEFTRLPTLQYLKIVLPPFGSPGELIQVFRSRVLRDLEVSVPGFLLILPDVVKPYTYVRPALDTFSVRKDATYWRILAQYVDLGRLKRLAVWDSERRVMDLKKDWGDLVTISAMTLEVLSLWLTKNILRLGLSDYIESIPGFPVLHTLSLLSINSKVGAVSEWPAALIPIIKAFYKRSPSLQHLRVYFYDKSIVDLHGWLLPGVPFSNFAAEIRELTNIQTIMIAFDIVPLNAIQEVTDSIVQMFHPVRPQLEFNMRWDSAWPFFDDDLDDS